MDFKSENEFRIIEFLYVPFGIYILLVISGVIKIWGAGANGIAFLFALASFILFPILLVISLISILKRKNK